MHLTDTIFLILVILVLNAAAMLASLWFYRGIYDVLAQAAWFHPMPGRKWFFQIVVIGAALSTYVMMGWSLGGRAVGLWFVLLCPPLFVLLAGFSVSVIIVFHWVCAFLAAALWPVTRSFAPLIATGLSALLVPPALDRHWDRVMCNSAADLGLSNIQRPPFLYNVARISSKRAREPYAIADDGEIYWDWGYSQHRFVKFQQQYPHASDLSQFTPLTCDPTNASG